MSGVALHRSSAARRCRFESGRRDRRGGGGETAAGASGGVNVAHLVSAGGGMGEQNESPWPSGCGQVDSAKDANSHLACQRLRRSGARPRHPRLIIHGRSRAYVRGGAPAGANFVGGLGDLSRSALADAEDVERCRGTPLTNRYGVVRRARTHRTGNAAPRASSHRLRKTSVAAGVSVCSPRTSLPHPPQASRQRSRLPVSANCARHYSDVHWGHNSKRNKQTGGSTLSAHQPSRSSARCSGQPDLPTASITLPHRA